MKAKFENFIEEIIPLESDREFLRSWVKNIYDGIPNRKGLCFYGSGPCGKSTLSRVISSTLESAEKRVSYANFDPRIKHPSKIKNMPDVVIFDGMSSSKTGLAKCYLEDIESVSVLVISNHHSDSIFRRCHTIITKEVEEMNPKMYDEMMDEKDYITSWFFGN